MDVPAPKYLFSPLTLGAIQLEHRVVMAPLTRLRSDVPGDLPGYLMLEYYTQRASRGGLIITEATTISERARGYLGAPGLYTASQASGWERIVNAVHQKGGTIVSQLWHVGRSSHSDFLDGDVPAGPSAEAPYEATVYTKDGWVPVTPGRSLRLEEIPVIVEDYRRAASRAKDAGFDGIEIHSGNGYLLDQFLQNGSNLRTDRYGGSIENRVRLLLEVMEAVMNVWPEDRIGVRISPNTQFNGMHDSSPLELFSYVGEALNAYRPAWLHIIEPRIKGNTEIDEGLPPVAASHLRKYFKGKIIAAGGFDAQSADQLLEQGDADAVAFGRHFIANPDLPERFRLGRSLNHYDRSTFYGGDARGYTDYPALQTT